MARVEVRNCHRHNDTPYSTLCLPYSPTFYHTPTVSPVIPTPCECVNNYTFPLSPAILKGAGRRVGVSGIVPHPCPSNNPTVPRLHYLCMANLERRTDGREPGAISRGMVNLLEWNGRAPGSRWNAGTGGNGGEGAYQVQLISSSTRPFDLSRSPAEFPGGGSRQAGFSAPAQFLPSSIY